MASSVSCHSLQASLKGLGHSTGRLGLLAASGSQRHVSSKSAFDLAIIGGGPGGYVAAIKAAQLGLRTACIEKRGALGGTCLNVGCIPSKALLNISHKYHEMVHKFPGMGIEFDAPKVDFEKVQKQKSKAVKGLTGGIELLFDRNNVTYVKGEAKLTGPEDITIQMTNGDTETLCAKNVIIATGSEPSPMPGGAVVADEKTILTSTGALALESVPQSMVVIGGGVIGLELGSVYRRFGTQVTVAEFLDRITPGLDGDISKALQKVLAKQGFSFKLSTKVTGVEQTERGCTVAVEGKNGAEKIECEKVLLAVGRRPYTHGLGLEDLGIALDAAGRIVVDHEFRVKDHATIRAIGDVISGPMLAHKAEEEGIAAVELISGSGAGHVNYDAIPSVVYTHPEVAGVGKTEEELKATKTKYRKGIFPFAANSRARTNDDADGQVKILTDGETDRILGAWIIGPNAGELIAELVLAIEYGASAEDIARTCHAHPTLSEAVKEACMAAYDKPIHFG